MLVIGYRLTAYQTPYQKQSVFHIINAMKYRIIYIFCCFVLCIAAGCDAFAAQAIRHYPLRYRFDGITNPVIAKNVNLTLQNFRSRLHLPITQNDIVHFCLSAPKFIHNAVAPYGYFKSQTVCTSARTQTDWYIHLQITLGQPLLITSVHLEIQGAGEYDKKFLVWKNNFPLKAGQILDTQKYEDAKTRLYDVATQHGYFRAKMIESQIKINENTNRAQITIIFNTGPRFRFGQTHFSQSPFHEQFLRKFLRYHEGEYYSAKKIEKTQEGMVNGGFFDQVLIKPVPAQATADDVPIKINLIPRKSKEYTFGLGYGTDTGPRATANIMLRQIGGQGHRLQTIIRASQNNSSFLAKYMIPGFDPATDLFTILAGASTIQQVTGNARNAKFALEYAMAQTHWKEAYSLAYLTERYALTNLPYTSTQLVYPTADVKYIRASRKTLLHRGLSAEFEVMGSNKNVLSETSFVQEVAHLRTLYTIRPTHTRVIFRTDLGYTDINTLYQLPLSLQLFAGGANSLRGFSYNAIGPGRNMAVGSFELQQRLAGAFYLAGFVDAGNVGNNNFLRTVMVGSGPGLAWISSIGTLELTYAEAITLPKQPWTVQFTMGSVL